MWVGVGDKVTKVTPETGVVRCRRERRVPGTVRSGPVYVSSQKTEVECTEEPSTSGGGEPLRKKHTESLWCEEVEGKME